MILCLCSMPSFPFEVVRAELPQEYFLLSRLGRRIRRHLSSLIILELLVYENYMAITIFLFTKPQKRCN